MDCSSESLGSCWSVRKARNLAAQVGRHTPSVRFGSCRGTRDEGKVEIVQYYGMASVAWSFKLLLTHTIVWYEWWPANLLGLDLAIRPGDSVTLSVTATSSTSGTVSVQNHSTGKSATQTVTSTTPLCQQNAEWILEAYVEGATVVPFADFGSVAFTKASAGFIKGGSVGPAKATVLETEQVRPVRRAIRPQADLWHRGVPSWPLRISPHPT
jgi:hypothetical protein